MANSFLFTTSLILSWYGSNIGVLLLNKYMLSHTTFKSPVALTLCHMAACMGMGLIVSLSGITPAKPLRNTQQFIKVAVLALIFCLTIVLGNASLQYIPVSFSQAIGATTPFFTAIIAYLLQGSTESRLTYATLIPVAMGVVIASGGEPLFHTIGFLAALLATCLRALKTVIQSILMTDPSEKLDPMTLLLYMSSVSIVLLVPVTLVLEPKAISQVQGLCSQNSTFAWWLLFNSILAYFVNLTNFLVTKYTSPLSIQVLGNAKGVVAAVVSVLVFGNPVTWVGALGYGVTVSGVVLYSEAKKRSKQSHKTTRQLDEALLADAPHKAPISPIAHAENNFFRSGANAADKV